MLRTLFCLAVLTTALGSHAWATTPADTPLPDSNTTEPHPAVGTSDPAATGPFGTTLDAVALPPEPGPPATGRSSDDETALLGSLLLSGAGIAWLYKRNAGGDTDVPRGATLPTAIDDALTDNGPGSFDPSGSGVIAGEFGAYLPGEGQPQIQALGGPPVPEPGTLALLGLGASGLLLRRRRAPYPKS
jgi:hypothetical protein